MDNTNIGAEVIKKEPEAISRVENTTPGAKHSPRAEGIVEQAEEVVNWENPVGGKKGKMNKEK